MTKAVKTRIEQKRRGIELADSLRAQGLSNAEVFSEITRQNIEYMERTCKEKGRCMRCWHPAENCICADLLPVQLRVPMRVIGWCHSRDYLNAGDDAKLLCTMAGAASFEMLMFGRPADDAILMAAVRECPERALLLFPDDTAITVSQFWSAGSRTGDGPAPTAESRIEEPLTVVVLNGTWGNVKPMLRHFNKVIDPDSRVRHVALEPTSLSVYARAQRRMKREVSLERICSVEAVVSERFPVTPLQHGLFTSELQWRSRGGNGVSDRGANGKRSGVA
jgi:DTW domain-containing protein YfiP